MSKVDGGLAWAIRICPRLLFAASVAMLAAGIVQFATFMASDFYYFATTELVFQTCFGPAACLLFGAVLTHRLAGR